MRKTIGTYFSQYFKMPHLYREELELIQKVIRNELKPKQYHIACDGMEYDTFEDVPAELSQTAVMVVYTHSPCLRLKFAKSWTELYSGDDGKGVDEAVRQIALIVSRGERKWLWAFCKYSAWLSPLLGFGSLAIIIGLIGLGALTPQSLYLAIWLLLLVSIWWAVGHRYSVHSFSRIEFHHSRQAPSSWMRHRERLLIFFAGVVLGGATMWLLAKFFRLI